MQTAAFVGLHLVRIWTGLVAWPLCGVRLSLYLRRHSICDSWPRRNAQKIDVINLFAAEYTLVEYIQGVKLWNWNFKANRAAV